MNPVPISNSINSIKSSFLGHTDQRQHQSIESTLCWLRSVILSSDDDWSMITAAETSVAVRAYGAKFCAPHWEKKTPDSERLWSISPRGHSGILSTIKSINRDQSEINKETTNRRYAPPPLLEGRTSISPYSINWLMVSGRDRLALLSPGHRHRTPLNIYWNALQCHPARSPPRWQPVYARSAITERSISWTLPASRLLITCWPRL